VHRSDLARLVERVVKTVLFTLALVACTRTTTATQPDAAAPPEVLPADAYYVQDNTPCGAPEPQDCVFELGFCTDASYRLLMGDVITVGTYQLEAGLAVDETRASSSISPRSSSSRATGSTWIAARGRRPPKPSMRPSAARTGLPRENETTVVQDPDVACLQ
jgi:hypothetical protein